MISVIFHTRNDEMALAHALSALVPAAAEGLVREVIVVDASSEDGTVLVADAAGCRIVTGSGLIGPDLVAAAAIARSDWLLFLSPSVMLEPGWQREVQDFIERTIMAGAGMQRAAAFRHARASFGWRARLAEITAALRSRLFTAPYPEEGLLVSARLYREIGGHRELPGMVEVDLARRIGRSRMSFLRSRAVLRGDIAERPGGFGRGLRNAACLTLFVLRVPAKTIGRLAA
jgi:glycosyltransferase involved in cell wall biosynthesis